MKIFQILLICSVGVIFASGRVTQQDEKRLIKTSEEKPGQWMTQEEIMKLIKNREGFIDITDSKYPTAVLSVKRISISTELRFQEIVKHVIANVNNDRVYQFVEHFSSYRNRIYSSSTGRLSQQWLLAEVEGSVKNYVGQVEVEEIDHGFPQQSIVTRLVGSDPNLKTEVIIFGAHLDTVNTPGADDNASGSAVCLETLRAIVEAGLIFRRTVEFHWYAAEEIGLRGSQAIAEKYKTEGINVAAMLNMDVVGYHVSGIDEISIYTDHANGQLVEFMRKLTYEYLKFGWRNNYCGYGCSDHATWYRVGFPTVFVAEAVDNPHMHLPGDDISKVDFLQVHEFIKLAIGYTIEIGEPATSANLLSYQNFLKLTN